jgi:hypothetical protein
MNNAEGGNKAKLRNSSHTLLKEGIKLKPSPCTTAEPDKPAKRHHEVGSVFSFGHQKGTAIWLSTKKGRTLANLFMFGSGGRMSSLRSCCAPSALVEPSFFNVVGSNVFF